jgi:hypothetical protein
MSINETLPALDLTQSGGQILNYQNTFDRVCDEIRMKIQTENFFGILISTRLHLYLNKSSTTRTILYGMTANKPV